MVELIPDRDPAHITEKRELTKSPQVPQLVVKNLIGLEVKVCSGFRSTWSSPFQIHVQWNREEFVTKHWTFCCGIEALVRLNTGIETALQGLGQKRPFPVASFFPSRFMFRCDEAHIQSLCVDFSLWLTELIRCLNSSNIEVNGTFSQQVQT